MITARFEKTGSNDFFDRAEVGDFTHFALRLGDNTLGPRPREVVEQAQAHSSERQRRFNSGHQPSLRIAMLSGVVPVTTNNRPSSPLVPRNPSRNPCS